jgi:hypothetical protein
MVICVAEQCNPWIGVTRDENIDDDYLKDEAREKIIKQKIKPYFTCSPHRADLSKVQYDVHPVLKALWYSSEEWHLLSTDHCDVYGFNIWAPVWMEEQTDMVFGGEEARKEWRDRQSKEMTIVNMSSADWSCANANWVCCIAFSEFDYLLVNLDRKSKRYGHVHHITSNTQKEAYCCTLDELLIHLSNFLVEGADMKSDTKDSVIRDYRATTKLNRSLKLVRKAVLDAMSRQIGVRRSSKLRSKGSK